MGSNHEPKSTGSTVKFVIKSLLLPEKARSVALILPNSGRCKF